MSLDLDKLSALFDLLASKDVAEFEHEENGVRLRVARGIAMARGVAPVATAAAITNAPAAQATAADAPPSGDYLDVTSPFVGSYYCSPTPDAPAFVEVGSVVRPGQTLCIIEAMKLMNEIESDADGVVVEIFPQNAQAVEFGEPLFAVRSA